MSGRRTVELPLDLIDATSRLRPISPANVEQLAESLERRGLDTPITVREPDSAGRHKLIAGGHRVAAARHLGWRTIEAFVVAADDSQAMLLEIEENLVRHDLTELDRAVFLARWKELYSQLSAGSGRRGRSAGGRGTNSSQLILPFSKAVHERLRMQPRSVNRAVARASLAPELRAALADHPAADNGSVLDMLVRLDVQGQRQIAALITPALSIGSLRRSINTRLGKGAPKRPDIAEAIIRLWDKATAEEKARVRRHIAPRSGRSDA